MGNYDISVFCLVFIKLFGNQDERTAQLIELNKDVFCQKKNKDVYWSCVFKGKCVY